MKLVINGDATIAGAARVLIDDPDIGERVAIRTVTRIMIDPGGAHIEAHIPELDVEIELPEAMGAALVELERLRKRCEDGENANDELRNVNHALTYQLAEGRDRVACLEAEVANLHKLLDASDDELAKLRSRNAEISALRTRVAALEKTIDDSIIAGRKP